MDRKYNNSHNGLNGTVRMVLTYMKFIKCAPSLTSIGRKLVSDIELKLEYLDQETWEYRVEPDGKQTIMRHKNKREFYR